jgi:hypothetical protein
MSIAALNGPSHGVARTGVLRVGGGSALSIAWRIHAAMHPATLGEATKRVAPPVISTNVRCRLRDLYPGEHR